MRRRTRLALLAAVATAVVLAVSWFLHAWGGVALVVAGAAAAAWYRAQVARGPETEAFFADAGEDTRLTSLQGTSPSELPTDRTLPGTLHRPGDPQQP